MKKHEVIIIYTLLLAFCATIAWVLLATADRAIDCEAQKWALAHYERIALEGGVR